MSVNSDLNFVNIYLWKIVALELLYFTEQGEFTFVIFAICHRE